MNIYQGATPIPPLSRNHGVGKGQSGVPDPIPWLLLSMARKDIYTVEDWADLAKQARYDPELLARLLRVGPRQLRRYTRELFNNSPQDWLDEQRLADAARLLQTNELIKVVAYDLGFKTVSHFSNRFKAHFGISPKDYKEQMERFYKYCNLPL